jgi:hypothetical protein
MAMVRTFRDLIAWQKAMELAKLVYARTRAMPSDERFGLTMQMRRAAVSVPSNIAEAMMAPAEESMALLSETDRVLQGLIRALECKTD